MAGADGAGATPAGTGQRRSWPMPELFSAMFQVRHGGDRAGFQMLARLWAIGRFFAWIPRHRRLARDFHGNIASATAFLYAMFLLARRLSRFA
jgi:transposase